MAGLKAMLAPFADRIQVVDTKVSEAGSAEAGRPSSTEAGSPGSVGLGSGDSQTVDLTLYDTFGRAQANQSDIRSIVADRRSGKVVIYSWNTHEQLVEAALAKGVKGYLSKSLRAPELVDNLVRIAAGDVIAPTHLLASDSPVETVGSWPGKREGLSLREAEVIALITQGYTNPEIADRIFVTVNSLKSYIRSAYRKMGVERRAQAVRWGISYGMLPPDGSKPQP